MRKLRRIASRGSQPPPVSRRLVALPSRGALPQLKPLEVRIPILHFRPLQANHHLMFTTEAHQLGRGPPPLLVVVECADQLPTCKLRQHGSYQPPTVASIGSTMEPVTWAQGHVGEAF